MRVSKRPLARFDLIEAADRIEIASGLDAAEKFLDAAESTFEELARMPLMGSPRPWLSAELADLRQWRVKGFNDYLIFYVPLGDMVEVVRVLHAKRDIQTLLADEEGQGPDD
jgi:toxin ParE1/3/4